MYHIRAAATVTNIKEHTMPKDILLTEKEQLYIFNALGVMESATYPLFVGDEPAPSDAALRQAVRSAFKMNSIDVNQLKQFVENKLSQPYYSYTYTAPSDVKEIPFYIDVNGEGRVVERPHPIYALTENCADITELQPAVRRLFDVPEPCMYVNYLALCTMQRLYAILSNKKLPGEASVQTRLPSHYTMPNSKVTNMLPEISSKAIKAFGTNTGGKGKEAFVKVSINYADEDIGLPSNFTAYDREVMNTVCSLFEADNTFVFVSKIYEVMCGGNSKVKPAQSTIDDITRSLDKMMRTTMKIDYTEQAKLYAKSKGLNPQDAESFIIEGNLLYAYKTTASIKGERVIGYSIIKKPLLYEYSQNIGKGQIISVPLRLLDNSKYINNTKAKVALTPYLMRRIETARHAKYQHVRIAYQTAFSECDLTTEHKTQQARYRDTVCKILTDFKDKEYIKDFAQYKSGRTFMGVDIEM